MNDKIKEKLIHLRQWLLITILAIFGITGWLFTNFNNSIEPKTYLAYFVVTFFGIVAIMLQIKIIKNINKIKDGNNNN